MKYLEYRKDQSIYECGQQADSFYVILNGQVVEEIKNPDIDKWDWAYLNYESLLRRKKDLDVKAI